MAAPRVAELPGRRRSLALAGGAAAACAVLALVDPSGRAGQPLCPTRALLGLDCPACGTLRGVHALTHGQVVQALDHNVLLAVAVPWALYLWVGWLGQGLGRSWVRPLPTPRWLPVVAVVVAAAFAVARNLPVEGLSWLASTA